jgi:hypothetical protein
MRPQNIFIFCLGYSLGAAMSMENVGTGSRCERFLFAAKRLKKHKKVFVNLRFFAARQRVLDFWLPTLLPQGLEGLLAPALTFLC